MIFAIIFAVVVIAIAVVCFFCALSKSIRPAPAEVKVDDPYDHVSQDLKSIINDGHTNPAAWEVKYTETTRGTKKKPYVPWDFTTYTRHLNGKKIVVKCADDPQGLWHDFPEHHYYKITVSVDGKERPEVSDVNHEFLYYYFCKPLLRRMRSTKRDTQMDSYNKAITEAFNEPNIH